MFKYKKATNKITWVYKKNKLIGSIYKYKNKHYNISLDFANSQHYETIKKTMPEVKKQIESYYKWN